MGITTAVILGGIVGAGAAELFQGFDKSPDQPNQPALPNQVDANKTGAANIASQRENLLRAGGQTDNTGGLGILTGSDVSKTTLVGG